MVVPRWSQHTGWQAALGCRCLVRSKKSPSFLRRNDGLLRMEDGSASHSPSVESFQLHKTRRMRRCVEIAAPRSLAPSFRIAVARIAATGGAFAFEEELRVLAVGALNAKRGLATPEAMWSAGAHGQKLRCEARAPGCGARVPDDGDELLALLGRRRVAARRASVLLGYRRIFVVEMRILVRVHAVEVVVRLWLEGIILRARGSIRFLGRLVRCVVGVSVTPRIVARGFRVVGDFGLGEARTALRGGCRSSRRLLRRRRRGCP